MTRLCTVCKQIMGEKCAHCGTEATPMKTNSNGQAMPAPSSTVFAAVITSPKATAGKLAPFASRASMPLCRGRTSRRRRVHELNRQQKSIMAGGTNAHQQEQ